MTGVTPTLAKAFVDAAARLYADGKPFTDPDISPTHGQFDADFPPMLITTGTRDLLMSQCVRLARLMRSGGVSVDLCVWENLWHVFEFYDEIPKAAMSLAEASEFMAAGLGKPCN